MKQVFLTMQWLGLLLFASSISSQYASTSDDLSYLFATENTKDPTKSWPDCSEPSNIHAEYFDTGETFMYWDQFSDKEYYEYKIIDAYSKKLMHSSLGQGASLSIQDLKESEEVYIRRVCRISNDDVLFSDWVLAPRASATVNCPNFLNYVNFIPAQGNNVSLCFTSGKKEFSSYTGQASITAKGGGKTSFSFSVSKWQSQHCTSVEIGSTVVIQSVSYNGTLCGPYPLGTIGSSVSSKPCDNLVISMTTDAQFGSTNLTVWSLNDQRHSISFIDTDTGALLGGGTWSSPGTPYTIAFPECTQVTVQYQDGLRQCSKILNSGCEEEELSCPSINYTVYGFNNKIPDDFNTGCENGPESPTQCMVVWEIDGADNITVLDSNGNPIDAGVNLFNQYDLSAGFQDSLIWDVMVLRSNADGSLDSLNCTLDITEVDCSTTTEALLDNSQLCSQFSYSVSEGQGDSCILNWSVPDGMLLNIVASQGDACQSISATAGEMSFTGTMELSVLLAIEDPEAGWQYATCGPIEVSCGEVDPCSTVQFSSVSGYVDGTDTFCLVEWTSEETILNGRYFYTHDNDFYEGYLSGTFGSFEVHRNAFLTFPITLADSTDCRLFYSPDCSLEPTSACDLFTYDIGFSGIDGSDTLCRINWNSQEEIINGSTKFWHNGVQYNINFNGTEGSFEVPTGSEFTIIYDTQNESCRLLVSADCNNDPIPMCESLIFEFETGYLDSQGDSICIVTWASSPPIDFGNVSYVENGFYGTTSISGDSGVFELAQGSSISVEYLVEGLEDLCSSSFLLDCQVPSDTIPQDTTDYSHVCEWLSIDLSQAQNSNSDHCLLEWEVPDTVNLSLDVCRLEGTQEICSSFSSQSGSTLLDPGNDYVVKSTIYIVSQGGDVIAQSCETQLHTCDPLPEAPLDPQLVCDVLALLQATPIDSQTLWIGFVGDTDNYFKSSLQQLGYSMDELVTQFNMFAQVDFEIKYSNEENPSTVTVSISEVLNQGDDSTIDFMNNLENWGILLENTSFPGFSGTASTTLTALDGTTHECGINNIPLIYENTEPPLEEPPIIELPEFECGEEQQVGEIEGQTPLTEAEAGNLFYIYDFPILVTQISGSGGTFSGTGIVPLPFGSKTAIVEFVDVKVNTSYQIYDGEVRVKADDPGNYPDFAMNPDTLSIGGDICLPPEIAGYDTEGQNQVTGLDDWGFDEGGIHSETGSEYDPNGFNQGGTHHSTGTEYNSCGCNREGMSNDDPPQPCDPSCPGDPGVTNFADSVSMVLPNVIDSTLNEIMTNLQDSLAQLNCNQYRTIIDQSIATLGFDRTFILGEGDKYYNNGMHTEFESEPKILNLNLEDRNADVETLEEAHVDLYQCDKASALLSEIVPYLTNNAEPENQEGIVAVVLERIKAWTPYQLTLYSDPEKFQDWIIEQLEDIIEQESGTDGYFGEVNSKEGHINIKQDFKSIFDFNNRSFNSIASRDEFVRFTDSKMEQLSDAFLAGNQYVGGYHRAYFLEELAYQQSMVNGGGSTNGNLLPIQISKQVGSYVYTIYLDQVVLTPTGARLSAYLIITDPGSGQRLVLQAENVNFGTTGLTEESTLKLLTDIEIRLNNAAMLVLKAGTTQAAWDCNGFAGLDVGMQVEFCRNFIIPLDPVTLEPKPDSVRYRLDLDLEIDSWLEFSTEIDAPPFAIAKYEDIKWVLEDMVLDFSSESTPEFEPPIDYESPMYSEGTGFSPLWKGFYMGSLTAHLNKSLSGSGDEPVAVSVQDVLIDDTGVSGSVRVENLISIDDGNMGGWPFSIEDFEIIVLHNQFAGAGFGGEINVPIFKENMDYFAVMYPDNVYEFTVTTGEEYTADLFLAKAIIRDDSGISIRYDNGDIVATATLNGKLTVDSDSEGNSMGINFPEATFEGFQISNKSPYFSAGTWGVSGSNVGAKVGGFGIDISNIAPYSPSEGYAGVGFDIAVSLSEGIDVKAIGGLGILGKLEETAEGKQKWVFDKIDPKKFCLEGSFPGVDEMTGCIEWYEGNNVYGKGFRGLARVKFSKFKADVAAVAQFGRVGQGEDSYKYFFVDALANLNLGISAGPLTLDGFGGGISYHMDSNFEANNVSFNNMPDLMTPPAQIGASFSGVVYTPNRNIGLGLKGSALFSLASKKELLNGIVTLGFQFNDQSVGGGLNKISLIGVAQMLKLNPVSGPTNGDQTQKPSSVSSKLSAYVSLELDFDVPSFHGDFGVFLDAGVVKGAGANCALCKASIHFDPEEWYVNIGTPTNRCGVKLDIPLLANASITTYLNMGTNIPDMPPLPQEVREIATKVNTNESLRKSGAGFIMGASFEIEMSLDAVIASAEAKAGVGFDLMVRNYDGYRCSGSSEPVGIDGWYAAGQLWAYVEGRLRVFGINILDVGLAAVLQARLPNPTWVQGTLGMRVKVPFLGSREVSIAFEAGDDCILVNDNGEEDPGIDVISFIDPIEGVSEVATDYQPKVYLNVPLNKELSIENLNGEPVVYKARIKEIILESQGVRIPIKNVHSIPYGATEFAIDPAYMLPANDSVYLEVIAEVYKNGELDETQSLSTHFFTQDGFDIIPNSNINAAYPADGMVNFYRKENNHEKGFIVLNQGQPELLYDIPDDIDQVVRVISESGVETIIDYDYEPFGNRIEFDLDPSIFNPEEYYRLQLVRLPKGYQPENNDFSSGPSAEIDPESSQASVIYTADFRASMFDKFLDKVAAINNAEQSAFTKHGEVIRLTKDMKDVEPFDRLEMEGSSTLNNLVEIRFKEIKDHPWYKSNLQARVYDIFPREITGGYYVPPGGTDVGINIPANICGGRLDYTSVPVLDVNEPLVYSTYVRGELAELGTNPSQDVGERSDVEVSSQTLRFEAPQMAKSHLNGAKESVNGCIQVLSSDDYCSDPGPLGFLDPSSAGGDMTPEEMAKDCIEFVIGEDAMATGATLNREFPSGSYTVDIIYKLPDGHVISRGTLNFVID